VQSVAILQCNVSYRSGAYNMTTVSKNGPKRFNETVEPMQRCKQQPGGTNGWNLALVGL
jgi:hypothetical protein